jgi:hypothetical protein
VRSQEKVPVWPREFAALLVATFALRCSTWLARGSVL